MRPASKIDNCQNGSLFELCDGAWLLRLVDRQRLYLPKEWADDAKRRKKCHVPKARRVQGKMAWIALDLLERSADVPHRWVAADDEF